MYVSTFQLIVIHALGCQWSVSLLLLYVIHFVIYAVISILQGLQGVQGRPGIKVDETKIEIPLCFVQISFNKAMAFLLCFRVKRVQLDQRVKGFVMLIYIHINAHST